MRLHARRLTAALLTLGALAVGTGACSRSGYPAGDATTNLQRNLQLPDSQRQCMQDRFGDAKVAAVMDPEHQPTDDERAAFVAAARACIPIADFASLLAASLQVDPDTPVPQSQADCVKLSIESMSSDDQDKLYIHFANPAALDADAVRDSTARMVSVCGLGSDDQSGTVVGPVPGSTPAGPTATGP